MKCFWFLLFSLITSAAMAQIKPADGLWGTIDDPAIGSGLMMTTQNGITVISVYTYDEMGQNTWYIASGSVNEENVFNAELYQSENGQNLLLENPQAATFVEQRKNISIEFQGSQSATMQIGEAEPKAIKPNHYGYATTYQFPDITGQWVLASKETEKSYILDIVESPFITPGILPPVYPITFESNHPSTEGWEINCIVGTTDSDLCFFLTDDQAVLEVYFSEIGNQKMDMDVVGSNAKYQAFRLNQDSRLLPNDGLWRPADDPAIGSGMAMRTQGDFTVVLLYTYDDEGRAVWQNAAGQFDENGKMVADLYTPNNGTAIENPSPSSAEFEGEPQTLEIQLQGTELATFSINGSTPKFIQNSNFYANLLNTENLIVNGKDFLFPEQSGDWTLTVDTDSGLKSAVISIRDISGTISPPPPGAPPAYYGSTSYDQYPEELSMSFVCPEYEILFDEVIDNCFGRWREGEAIRVLNIQYENIGLNNFRLHLESENNETEDSKIIKFHRIDE